MSYIEESRAAGRHILPDLVRAFAVLGIVLVNVAYFAYPATVVYYDGGMNSSLDYAAYFGVNALFTFKSYTLFSLMFGVGFAFQMRSANRRNMPFGYRYIRRLLGLLILGALHVTFAFAGDILILYAVLGVILYLFKNKTVKSLVRWGVGLLTFQIVLYFLIVVIFCLVEIYAPEELAEGLTETDTDSLTYYKVFVEGSLLEVMKFRWIEWSDYLLFAGPLQAPGVFAFFVFGLAMVKSGIISDTSAPIWSKARRTYFPFGVGISFVASYFMMIADSQFSSLFLIGLLLVTLGSPFATFGYVGWLAKWAAGPDSVLKTFIARGGTATLTAYLLQSIILSFVFCGYGLGFYGKIGAAGCIAIALVTGIFTLVFVSCWRSKFARGPFEYLLRGFTYWGYNR